MAENIGEFTVTSRAYLRDDQSGQFLAAVHEGARSAVSELAETLADLVRTAIAAAGLTLTGELISSVDEYRVSAQEGGVTVDSDHAAPLEFGARDHPIPNAFGSGVTVMWRGKGRSKYGYHFVKQAADALTAISGTIVRKHMP